MKADLRKLSHFERVKVQGFASLADMSHVINEFMAVYNCESDGYDGDLIQRQTDAMDARRYMLDALKEWGSNA